MAISPEKPELGEKVAERIGSAFPILSDEGNSVAREFGLVFELPEALRKLYEGFGIDLPRYNGDESGELPIPASFVIAPDGTIAFAFGRVDYTHRAEPADIIVSLEKLPTAPGAPRSTPVTEAPETTSQ